MNAGCVWTQIINSKYHNEIRYALSFTKVVALTLQFLDKKDKDEPPLSVDEDAPNYEA